MITPAAPSDTNLIRLCAEFDELEWRLQALCDEHSKDNTLEGDMRFEASYELIRDAQEELLSRICALPAVTAEGTLAKAATLIYFTSNVIGCNDDSWGERLTISMRRDLTKAGWPPAPLASGPAASPAASPYTKPVQCDDRGPSGPAQEPGLLVVPRGDDRSAASADANDLGLAG